MAYRTFNLALLTLVQIAAGATFTYPAKTDLSDQLGCTPLRILCVGDSITKGSLSSSGDGFRGYLQSMLVNGTNGAAYGGDIDFVGTLRDGNMTDNSHDGKSGAYLADLVPVVQQATNARPNIVLIHAGSNDMDKNVNVSTAIDRMEAIVRAVHDGAPDATIFLAQLIVANSEPMQVRTDAFNPQLSGLVNKLRAEPDNFSILDVNMSRILNNSEIADRKHPDDYGYSIMAKAWYDAISNATSAGMLAAPEPPKAAANGLGLGLKDDIIPPNITCKDFVPPSSTQAIPSGTSVTHQGAASGAAAASAASTSSLRGAGTHRFLVSSFPTLALAYPHFNCLNSRHDVIKPLRAINPVLIM